LLSSVLLAVAGASRDTRFVQLGTNFWNARGIFKLGPIDIGTHMSIIQVSSGRFVIFDTIEPDSQIQQEISTITANGTQIEAIVATHPFHTTYFPAFYAMYPNVKFFGTPRHLRTQPQIPWAGSVWDCDVRRQWLPDIRMRIPQGGEFVAPQPELINHFSGMHVFHPKSGVMHVDDTLSYAADLDSLVFHPSIAGPGLYHTRRSPDVFASWVQEYLNEWNINTLAMAHKGVLGNGRQRVQKLLDNSRIFFIGLQLAWRIKPTDGDDQRLSDFLSHEAGCYDY